MQIRILQVLWKNGRMTAREITDKINESGKIAHTTVQTLLKRMEKKGIVGYDVDNRTFIYYPLVHEEDVKEMTVDEVVNAVFSGSADGLISYLIKKEPLSPDTILELRKYIDEQGE